MAWGLGMPAQSPYSHSTSAFNLGVSTIVCQLRSRPGIPRARVLGQKLLLVTRSPYLPFTFAIECCPRWCQYRARHGRFHVHKLGELQPLASNVGRLDAQRKSSGRRALRHKYLFFSVNCCFVRCQPSSCPAALLQWNH